MRIVGGKFRGRTLATPGSMRIRPTSDRTRESLFNIIANKIDLEGARVMDVFAGTGALGLEAVSRGAGFALFVEESAEGRGLLRTNIEALGLQGETKIFKRDATKLFEIGTLAPFDLVFMDPPYGKGLGEKAMAALVAGNWLKPGAQIILEEAAASLPKSVDGFEINDIRQFGETAIGFLNISSHSL